MRNKRSALLALGLAGAAYAWRNRAQLREQFSRFGQPSTPQQLPDYQSNKDSQQSNSTWDQSRNQQFGGSDV